MKELEDKGLNSLGVEYKTDVEDRSGNDSLCRQQVEQTIITPTREQWVDYAKGIAIFLVVVGHVLAGLKNSSILNPGTTYLLIYRWIYAFHMPVFFVLSGYFANRAASKPWKQFSEDKLRTLAYPYFLWAGLQTLLAIAMSHHANRPSYFADLWRIPYQAPGQFWFIYTLFIIVFVHGVLHKNHVKSEWFFFLAVAVCATQLLFIDLGSWEPLYRFREYLPYFALGVLIADGRVVKHLKERKTAQLLGLVLLGYALVLFGTWGQKSTDILIQNSLALIGIAATFALAITLERYNIVRFVAFWGRSSLQIYLAHVVMGSGSRIIIDKLFGINNDLLHLIIGISAGIYGPIFLQWGAERLGFMSLFSLRKGKRPV